MRLSECWRGVKFPPASVASGRILIRDGRGMAKRGAKHSDAQTSLVQTPPAPWRDDPTLSPFPSQMSASSTTRRASERSINNHARNVTRLQPWGREELVARSPSASAIQQPEWRGGVQRTGQGDEPANLHRDHSWSQSHTTGGSENELCNLITSAVAFPPVTTASSKSKDSLVKRGYSIDTVAAYR